MATYHVDFTMEENDTSCMVILSFLRQYLDEMDVRRLNIYRERD